MTQYTYQERFKTLQGVFDEHTNRALFELQSRGVFDELQSPWKVGKESNVFLASRKDVNVNAGRSQSSKVIVKIYRVQNCDFKRMFSYIRQDPRYAWLQNKRRQIIFAWVQREYRNLMKASSAGVSVPKVLSFKDNIIVEEMIGDTQPAPVLKDAYPQNTSAFFREVLLQMRKLYGVGIVHGDLSAFNILNFREKPYLIDFSQATMLKSPNAQELLERDVKNICQFFVKLGVKADPGELREKIVT